MPSISLIGQIKHQGLSRWTKLSAIFVLTLVFVCNLQAQDLHSDRASPVNISSDVAQRIKGDLGNSLGFSINFYVTNKQIPTPFYASISGEQICNVFINSYDLAWEAWDKFAQVAELSPSDSYYFALLHEIGHCVNKLTPTARLGILKPGVDSELFSDIFGLMLASRFLDEQSHKSMVNGVIKARLAQQGWFFKSTHTTGSRLKGLGFGLISSAKSHLNSDFDEYVQLSQMAFLQTIKTEPVKIGFSQFLFDVN